MKVKVKDAIDLSLDWMVAQAEKSSVELGQSNCLWLSSDKGLQLPYTPSSDCSQGGLILDREEISTIRCDDDYKVDRKGFTTNKRIPVWAAASGQRGLQRSFESEHYPEPQYEICESEVVYGPTRLIAGMRHHVLTRLGEEVDVPDEICRAQGILQSEPNRDRQRSGS